VAGLPPLKFRLDSPWLADDIRAGGFLLLRLLAAIGFLSGGRSNERANVVAGQMKGFS
jgi:hypothetical protein